MTVDARPHEGLLASRYVEEEAADAWLEIRPGHSGGTIGYGVSHNSGTYRSHTMVYVYDVGGRGSALTAGVTVGQLIEVSASGRTDFGYTGQSGTQVGVVGTTAATDFSRLAQHAHIATGVIAGTVSGITVVGVGGVGSGPYNVVGKPSNSMNRSAWLEPAKTELEEVLEAAHEGLKSCLRELSCLFLDACAWLSVDAPAIDLDHDLNVEFFWRSADEGLLVVIRRDGSIHFFGNSKGESWRSDYLLSGSVWRSHLPIYLSTIRQNA